MRRYQNEETNFKRGIGGCYGNGGVRTENLISALKRFDCLETVIAELEVYDDDRGDTIDDLAEYLNDEADYANS